MNKSLFLLAGAAVAMASCSSDNDVKDNNIVQADTQLSPITLTVTAGDQSRVSTYVSRGLQLNKWQRLQLIGTIDQSADAETYNWSATALAFDGDIMYVTWHSDMQATNPATQWGGQIDVVNVNTLEILGTAQGEAEKFNNVLVYNGVLYLSATDAKIGAAVGVVTASELAAEGTATMSRIGFPGNSLNALAESNGTIYGVSGYSVGVLGSFDPTTVSHSAFNWEYNGTNTKEHVDIISTPLPETYLAERTLVNGVYEDIYAANDNNYGGKDVKVYNGETYVLRQGEDAAYLNDMELDFTLETKDLKEIEKDVLGEWTLAGKESYYYGKHIMSIANGYAYIGAGKNGLKVVDIATGTTVDNDAAGMYTTATCVVDNKLYAATGDGLRVYNILDGGKLELEAFQVVDYDENGVPTSNAQEGVEETFQSCNFVAVHGDYVYVANGQSGVWVFKYIPDGGEYEVSTSEE